MNLQEEMDELARANSWRVTTGTLRSAYARGAEVLTLWFNEEGTVLHGTDHIERIPPGAQDGKDKVRNLLRRRWRTYVTGDDDAGSGS
jgi:hypothetical protein